MIRTLELPEGTEHPGSDRTHREFRTYGYNSRQFAQKPAVEINSLALRSILHSATKIAENGNSSCYGTGFSQCTLRLLEANLSIEQEYLQVELWIRASSLRAYSFVSHRLDRFSLGGHGHSGSKFGSSQFDSNAIDIDAKHIHSTLAENTVLATKITADEVGTDSEAPEKSCLMSHLMFRIDQLGPLIVIMHREVTDRTLATDVRPWPASPSIPLLGLPPEINLPSAQSVTIISASHFNLFTGCAPTVEALLHSEMP
ncbi:hypothetical protein FB451DRAFT_1184763 [Mycena latifolia]|nr:hypothetical protein FB451DRAFT_1184763 [Mycena latifolia]